MIQLRQRGIAAVEIMLIVVAVALVGVAGYAVMNQQDKTDTPSAAHQTETASAPAAPEVNNTNDLTTAEQTLDNTEVDATAADSTELDSQVSNF